MKFQPLNIEGAIMAENLTRATTVNLARNQSQKRVMSGKKFLLSVIGGEVIATLGKKLFVLKAGKSLFIDGTERLDLKASEPTELKMISLN